VASETLAEQLLQEVIGMEDSVTYQAIVRKGYIKGQAEGAVEELKKTIQILGRKRFRRPPSAPLAAALDAITDLQRLEQLSVRLLDVETWNDLMELPLPQTRSRRRRPT
jgi:hypothetical protein